MICEKNILNKEFINTIKEELKSKEEMSELKALERIKNNLYWELLFEFEKYKEFLNFSNEELIIEYQRSLEKEKKSFLKRFILLKNIWLLWFFHKREFDIKKFWTIDWVEEDMIQVMIMFFLRSIDTFKIEMDKKFTTYVYHQLLPSLKLCESYWKDIRIPLYIKLRDWKILNLSKEFFKDSLNNWIYLKEKDLFENKDFMNILKENQITLKSLKWSIQRWILFKINWDIFVEDYRNNKNLIFEWEDSVSIWVSEFDEYWTIQEKERLVLVKDMLKKLFDKFWMIHLIVMALRFWFSHQIKEFIQDITKDGNLYSKTKSKELENKIVCLIHIMNLTNNKKEKRKLKKEIEEKNSLLKFITKKNQDFIDWIRIIKWIDWEEMTTLQSIWDLIWVSKERIRQIELESISFLRKKVKMDIKWKNLTFEEYWNSFIWS